MQSAESVPAAGPAVLRGSGRRRRIILISSFAAGLVVLLLVASVVVHVVNGARYGPEATVRSYLTAISQGKASQANALVHPGVTAASTSLLTDDVLGASAALMKNARVTGVSTLGDSAVARVTYSVDGTAFAGALELTRVGRQGVFFDAWRIDEPLVSTISVHVSRGTTVSVNGTDVDVGAEQALPAYPGSYEIDAPGGGFFEAESQTVHAGAGADVTVELVLTPSEELTTAVQKALDRHLDDCAASTIDDPEGCGMYTGARYDFASEPTLKYTVDKYPVVTVDESGSTFSSEGGRVTAVATGTLYGGGSGSRSYTTAAGWGLRGSIVIDGSRVTLADVY